MKDSSSAAEHREAAGRMAAECLCFRGRRVSRVITRIYDETLRPLGIRATQLTVLNAVALAADGCEGAGVAPEGTEEADRAGGPMARLAEVLAMDPSTLSRNLGTLSEAGLVRIEPVPEDRRMRRAVLTREGERTVAEALPLWNRAHERVVRALGEEAAAELRRGFDAALTASGPEG